MNKVIFALLFTAVFVLSACGGVSNTSPEETLAPIPAEYAGKTSPLGAEAAGEGAKVFQTNCEPCHGPQGHGDGPAGQALDPHPKNLAEFQSLVGDDYLFWRISEGRPGTSMIAWKGALTEEQIWQAVSFIHTLK